MKSKGFTLIELLIVIAILGIIAAVVSVTLFGGISNNEPVTNETAVDNATIFQQLSSEPISSLNLTALNFMVDYCLSANTNNPCYELWLVRTTVYQNQIIINELKEQP